MKVYQIGGAVRDVLLGLEPKDFDYVVVGSSVEEMKLKGFKQVGKTFPVFLDPVTKSEYALARKEIKIGPKHTDFKFIFSPDISLEEDVQRRDFTINALALDESTNEVVDYVDGQNDLKNKIIKHINSDHFVEDPLRVLRMCRFSAQLDFSIHQSTMDLAKRMVHDGMLKHLTPERVFAEIEKALNSKHFDKFVLAMQECGALKEVLPEVDVLFSVPENKKYHPEKNSGLHTILALQYIPDAEKEIKFSVLLHDVGKGLTPKDVLPKHPEHDINGEPVVKEICQRLKVPNSYKKLALLSVKNHMMIRTVPQMSYDELFDFVSLISDKFRLKEKMERFISVCKADLYGRAVQLNERELSNFENAVARCFAVFNLLTQIKITQILEIKNLSNPRNIHAEFKKIALELFDKNKI